MLKDLEKRHRNEPCFILACGYSLKKLLPLEELDPYVTIGVNRIVYSYHPTYWMFIDQPIVKEFGKQIDLRIIASEMIRWEHSKYNGEGRTFVKSNTRRPEDMHPDYKGLMFCNTTSFAALHLAYIMGCNPIVFCGLDLCYLDGYCHFYDDKQEKLTKPSFRKKTQSRALVQKKYPDGRVIWTRNDFIRMERNIRRACKALLDKGHTIYNVSQESMLEGVPKRPLNEILSEL